MEKYPAIYATDACVLDEVFSQTLYAIKQEIGVPGDDYEFPESIMEYTTGVRPLRGRDWSTCSKFYIPVNVREKHHWILAVVELRSWRVVVYDSIPHTTGSKEELELVMEPYTKLFPLILQKRGKFERYSRKFRRDLKLVSASDAIVPRNRQM